MGKNATQAGSIDTAGYKLTSEVYLNLTKDQAQSGFKWIAPMEMFDAFSRVKMILLETGKEKNTCVDFNIKPQDIALIMKKLDFCVDAMMLKKHNDAGKTAAQTPVFHMGSLKGKTPYQVFVENGREALVSQRNFLYQNIQKFPNNAPLITEIDRVLAGGTGQEAEHYVIYEEKFKIPNAKKVDAQGKTRAYGVTISCFPGNTNAPFKVSAFECKCIPKTDERGMTCAAKGSVSDKKMLTADFDERNFYNFISGLKQRVDGFVYSFTAWAIKTSDVMYAAERQKAINTKNNTHPVNVGQQGEAPNAATQGAGQMAGYGYQRY